MAPSPAPLPDRTRHRRVAAAVTAIGVVLAGLVVHAVGTGDTGDVAGDALYAALIYLAFACALPRASAGCIAVFAAIVCAAIELAQLTGIPRVLADGFPPIALVLGSGFDPRDLLVYAVAAVTCALIDVGLNARRLRRAGGPETTEGALPEESAF